MRNVKIVIVGETDSGKSSLIYKFVKSEFPSNDILPILNHGLLDNTACNMMVDGTPFAVSILDTPGFGKTDFNKIRPLYYPGTDIFLLCIDISNIQSFKSNLIEQKYIDELRHYSTMTPIILIGTKSDLRWKINHNSYTNDISLISIKDLKELCVITKSLMYIEVSAQYTEINQINDMFGEIIRAAMPRGRQRRNGMKLPKTYNINMESYIYDESKDIQINIKSNTLLIYGFIHQNNTNSIIPKDIVMLIWSFWSKPKPDICYYKNGISGNNMMQSFGANDKLKRDYYIMFWMDLIAIIIHNFGYYLFSVQLFVRSRGDILSFFALSFCILESLIIIISYIFLLFHSKIEYYTHPMSMMHIAMELFVNLPMIIIQIIYLLSINDKSQLISLFFVSICIYFLYGLYKYFLNGIYWANKNQLRWEMYYINCIIWHCGIWICSMFSLLIIGIVYVVRNNKNEIAILLTVLSILSCVVISVLGVVQFTAFRRRY